MSPKKILLGVSGGIAAYKAVDFMRALQKAGHDVTVMMTKNATKFINPLTFQALSGHPVGIDLFDGTFSHIDLARSCDAIVIAPATANIIAKIALGIADDLLSTTIMARAWTVPLIIAPAMNSEMWQSKPVIENTQTLHRRHVTIVPPASGTLACGEIGYGRLAHLENILHAVYEQLTHQDLTHFRLVVTAGPTRERIDPVRYITNDSSGKMGYALATQAALRGAQVTLISGHTNLPNPPGVKTIRVESAHDMKCVTSGKSKQADALIMAAAVADFRPTNQANQKLHKGELGDEPKILLTKNTDILAEMGKRNIPALRVGFAAETGEETKGLLSATAKLKAKNCHLLVYNRVDKEGQGFGSNQNAVTIIDRKGESEKISLDDKTVIANRILDRLAGLYQESN